MVEGLPLPSTTAFGSGSPPRELRSQGGAIKPPAALRAGVVERLPAPNATQLIGSSAMRTRSPVEFLQHRVDSAQKRAATRHGDALVDDVGRQLRLRMLERGADHLDDLVDGLGERLGDLRLAEHDLARHPAADVAAANRVVGPSPSPGRTAEPISSFTRSAVPSPISRLKLRRT